MFSSKITGERIYLRPYKKADTVFWQKWDTDSEVQVFMPGLDKELALDDQLKYLEECRKEKSGIYWSILWKENNQLIGTVSVTEINKIHGTGELGIIIGEKDYWGRGIATEAISLVLKCVLSSFGLRRIVAEYEKGNKGMRKALENNGFRRECFCKESRMKNNKPIDTIRYYILLRKNQ